MITRLCEAFIVSLTIISLILGSTYLYMKVNDVMANGFEHHTMICQSGQDYINDEHNEYHD
jgi:hypothetical protein